MGLNAATVSHKSRSQDVTPTAAEITRAAAIAGQHSTAGDGSHPYDRPLLSTRQLSYGVRQTRPLAVHTITQSGQPSHLSRRHPQEQHRRACAVKKRLMALNALYARMLSVPVCAGRRPTAREKPAGVAWSHVSPKTFRHEYYQSLIALTATSVSVNSPLLSRSHFRYGRTGLQHSERALQHLQWERCSWGTPSGTSCRSQQRRRPSPCHRHRAPRRPRDGGGGQPQRQRRQPEPPVCVLGVIASPILLSASAIALALWCASRPRQVRAWAQSANSSP